MRIARAFVATAAVAGFVSFAVFGAGCGGGGGAGGGAGDGDPQAGVPPHERGSYLNMTLPSVIAKGEETHVRLRVITQAGLPDYDFEGGFRVEARFAGMEFPEEPRWEPHQLGFYQMNGYVFDAPGVHFLRAVVPDDTVQAFANAVVVQEDPEYRIFWGDLNGQTDLSNGLRGPGVYYWYARAVALLDFAAITDHDALPDGSKELTDEDWADVRDYADENGEDGAFLALLGLEWTSKAHGNRIVLFDETPTSLPTVASGVDTPAKLRAALGPGDLVLVPHPSGSGAEPPVDPETLGEEELVEIYSGLGIFEEPESLRPAGRDTPGAYVRDLLARGLRIGFTANADTRVSLPGNPRPFVVGEHRWPGGLTAVLAKELTRESVLEALRARRCYATTGARYLMEFTVDGQPMGSEVRVPKGHEAAIYGSLGSTSKWLRMEVLGPDGVVGEFTPPPDDADVIELETTTKPIDEPTWVYLRGIDETGGMAWSSPVYLIPE